ncbi:Glutamate-1-semialdehyde 2,1-aminomutase [Striga asiatica]|uniref:Glutamate-1-semialdehyde 2,1-aminomutase n=1 Tax=Striga asiatica TaxID=4170 RepID=A0A5A7R3H0_STRAF|nr:Glutamate-1-semialdehyde 2,1-aminomutase [Striga asiatica]
MMIGMRARQEKYVVLKTKLARTSTAIHLVPKFVRRGSGEKLNELIPKLHMRWVGHYGPPPGIINKSDMHSDGVNPTVRPNHIKCLGSKFGDKIFGVVHKFMNKSFVIDSVTAEEFEKKGLRVLNVIL